MTRTLRLALATVALVGLLVVASPVAATEDGAAYGAHVAHHATTEGGFSGACNPGMHRGFSERAVCPGH